MPKLEDFFILLSPTVFVLVVAAATTYQFIISVKEAMRLQTQKSLLHCALWAIIWMTVIQIATTLILVDAMGGLRQTKALLGNSGCLSNQK